MWLLLLIPLPCHSPLHPLTSLTITMFLTSRQDESLALHGYPNKGRETNPDCLSPSHHHGCLVCLLPFNTCPDLLGLYLQWLPVRLRMIQIPCSVLQDLALPAWPLLSFTAFSSARSSEPNPSPPQDCTHCLLFPLLRKFFPIYHRALSSAGSSCNVWSGYPVAGSHNLLAGLAPPFPMALITKCSVPFCV